MTNEVIPTIVLSKTPWIPEDEFFAGKGTKAPEITGQADGVDWSQVTVDIGDISFDEEELDTELEVNPHPATGLSLKGRTWTSFDNSRRVY